MDHTRVLVLNQTYEPINICNARRAVRLMLLGKAESVEADGFLVRSEFLEFRLPVVIRLLRYIHLPRRGEVPFSKKNICRRDHYVCQYCGTSGGQLTIDHVVPRSRGGRSSWDNVVCSCRPCNAHKGDRTPEEAGMSLLRKPRQPRFFHLEVLHPRVSESIQIHWEKYLGTHRAS